MIKVDLDNKELQNELKRNREFCKNLFKLKPILKHIVYAINIPKNPDITYAADIMNRRDDFHGMHIFNGTPIEFDTDVHFNKYVDNLYEEFGSDITIYAVHNDNPVHGA